MTDFHSDFMLIGCFLQHKPVPLHWEIFCSFISGFGSYENGMCVDIRVAVV